MKSEENAPARAPWETWDECDGKCEACPFAECREASELEELNFEKMLKEFAVSQMLRRIAEIEKRIEELERQTPPDLAPNS